MTDKEKTKTNGQTNTRESVPEVPNRTKFTNTDPTKRLDIILLISLVPTAYLLLLYFCGENFFPSFLMQSLSRTDIAEEVWRYQSEKRRSRIWGIIIIALIAAVLAFGIVSFIRSNKDEKNESAQTE